MAVIHNTTLKPTKLELLTTWLPSRPWYRGTGREPQLARVGGFRLDDPQGEVGIECLVVTDRSGDAPVSYFVPLTYRGAPLDGAEQGLVGTLEHGILGRRWIYDGAHDPVLAAELLALFQGRAEPQAQDASDARDGSVHHRLGEGAEAAAIGALRMVGPATVVSGPDGTDLTLDTTTEAAADGRPGHAPATLALHIGRVLEPLAQEGATSRAGTVPECLGSLTGVWQSADGAEARGLFATLGAADR
ncbi:hypothetical protein [Streptomyces sp. 769]|uniref:maltokinase N-terminal cap-like domain-containing protein n=1 Tax=Streptomyces sp. 769 TaxID=1262452 RepID=UPI00057CC8E9|nr:hypothetical protein [Streptomyces sp. 769]AJC61174.1 hypothetical protein GZL_08648 [Streptomyces sp. 769]